MTFDRVMLQLNPFHAQQAFDTVIDVHQEVAVMSKWSSVREWGLGVLPVLEQHQQVVPPDLAVFLEAHSTMALKLLGVFG